MHQVKYKLEEMQEHQECNENIFFYFQFKSVFKNGFLKYQFKSFKIRF